ncbi:MAG: hypothetical protein AUJ92_03140 [Armatimonadetes bacterium CG2_30_59_28]|nr:MAG: hypothetical protein AUJ92_03140 [Armatimonadetes bacterium CG2_30_59_28]PIU64637.1 MAG: hypothetical protein COS85_11755 [Armatimonadetes bacterium CG07_land_8_20_14_0_80_59_28]
MRNSVCGVLVEVENTPFPSPQPLISVCPKSRISALRRTRRRPLIAAVLVVLVVAFFLTGWQRILVVVLTLPLTLLASAYVASLLDFSHNLFSLAGIVVAQVGDAVVGATATFFALFLPFLMVSGLSSLLFRELILLVAVAKTDRVLQRIEEVALKLSGVKQCFRLSAGKVWGLVTYQIPHEGEVDIELTPPHERPLNTDEWVDKYGPEIVKAAMVPGARIKPMHMKMRGIRQLGEFDVEVELRAPRTESMESMAETANQVRARLKELPMLTKLDVSLDVTKPEYQVRVDRVRAGDLGLTAADVARTVRTYVDGAVPTRYHEGGYYYDLRVTTREGTVKDRATLEALPVPLPGGGYYTKGR